MTAKTRGNTIQIDFTYQGERCRETIKKSPTKTNLKEAHHLHSKIVYEINAGDFDYRKYFPNSKRAQKYFSKKSGNQSVKDALLSYLDVRKRSLAFSTYSSYESAVNHHLIPTFGNYQLADLTTQLIRQWMGGLVISAKRINNVLIPLRGMLGDAFADGTIDRNPMDRIKNLKVHQEDPEPFSFEEQQRILAALPEQGKNLIQFAFWTGLRTSELIALEWGDIDRVRNTAYIQRACVRGVLKHPKTKAGKREVTLLPLALDALENQREFTFKQGKQIFHNPETNRPWSSDVKIRHPLWKNALKAAGVRYRNPYQTRHTYASMLLSAGENPAWIAKQMGHSNMQTLLRRYARWMPDHDPLAGKKIIARMSQIGHSLEKKKKKPRNSRALNGGASGTRTPDTRIMIPKIRPYTLTEILNICLYIYLFYPSASISVHIIWLIFNHNSTIINHTTYKERGYLWLLR
ncbi:MAG: site-specific integrase [Mariprofundus sp.]|nr:site-specific integrase [Mariprofundus sp.]